MYWIKDHASQGFSRKGFRTSNQNHQNREVIEQGGVNQQRERTRDKHHDEEKPDENSSPSGWFICLFMKGIAELWFAK
jgi:hypothetical protein